MARRHINREQVIQRICDALKAGNLRKTAVVYAGIDQATFYRWLGDNELCKRIEEAEAQAEAYHVTNIRRHADKQWTASAWWLERNPRTKQDWKKLDERDIRLTGDAELIARAGAALNTAPAAPAAGDGSPGPDLPEFDD